MKEISGVRLLIVRKNKIWDQQQVRLLYCGILPSFLLVPLFLLVSWFHPLASGLPVFFVFCLWCCSESEDSANNSRIQHSNCLWFMFDFLSLCTWVHLKTCCIAFCPLTVCVCTPCQRASSTSKTDSFLWCHGPDTLACKARPSFDGCGTSLSVSLSLSPGFQCAWPSSPLLCFLACSALFVAFEETFCQWNETFFTACCPNHCLRSRSNRTSSSTWPLIRRKRRLYLNGWQWHWLSLSTLCCFLCLLLLSLQFLLVWETGLLRLLISFLVSPLLDMLWFQR